MVGRFSGEKYERCQLENVTEFSDISFTKVSKGQHRCDILGPVNNIFLQRYSCPRDLRIGGVGGDMKKSWGVLSGIVKVGHAAMVQLFQSEEILFSINNVVIYQ